MKLIIKWAFVGALLTGLLILSACDSKAQEIKSETIIPVKVVKVNRATLAKSIHGSGLLAASRQMKLSFKIGGIIAKMNVEEGQAVGKGRVLAELDQAEISARFTQAKSALEKAQRDFERVNNLYADSVATLEQMQNVETGLQLARADFQVAAFNLKYAKITAPANGKILRRFAERNELVGAGMPVFYFASSEEAWKVRVGVGDRDILRLQTGDSATVQFDAWPGRTFSGEVSEIGEAADPRSGTFEVEVILPQNSVRLISGFVAAVDIFPARKQDYWLVPASALVEADKTSGFVYKLNEDGNHVQKTRVSIGYISGEQFALKSGVADGQVVITDGAAYLRDGALVEVVNE